MRLILLLTGLYPQIDGICSFWFRCCVRIFSELFFLQLFLLLVLVFIYSSSDLFYFILYSVLFLFGTVGYCWFYDGDIFMNFLLIIDLGLYFLFFIFFLHYSNLFTALPSINLNSNKIYIFSGFALYLILSYQSGYLHSYDSGLDTLSVYDWYSLSLSLYASDLQLLSELYFGFNLFEFVLMNFYIYITLLLVYYILYLPVLYSLRSLVSGLQVKTLLRYSNHSVFIKLQDLDKQRLSKESVGVWGSSSTGLK